MPIVRAQVVIPAVSTVPEDVVVNTWGFNLIPADTTNMALIRGHLKTFYDAWATHRSSLYVWDQARLKFYDLSQPKPRAPIFDELIGLAATKGTTSLPQEMALCLSFQGLRVSGQAQARRRGRVYLGPFVTNANQGTTGRPDTTVMTAIRDAALAFVNNVNTEVDRTWVVIHDANGANPTAVAVNNGWVDNAWDVQRRRGTDPSSRLTFTEA